MEDQAAADVPVAVLLPNSTGKGLRTALVRDGHRQSGNEQYHIRERSLVQRIEHGAPIEASIDWDRLAAPKAQTCAKTRVQPALTRFCLLTWPC